MVCVPYNPDTGAFITNAVFLSRAVDTAGPYSLERDARTITISQGGSVIFTHTAAEHWLTHYFFYGTNSRYLAIEDIHEDFDKIELFLVLWFFRDIGACG